MPTGDKGLELFGETLYLLGQYLEEEGYIDANPAMEPREYDNAVFAFTVDKDGISGFEFYPTGAKASWYIWVERAFYADRECSSKECLNMLFQCIASLGEIDTRAIQDQDVLTDWEVHDDEEDS